MTAIDPFASVRAPAATQAPARTADDQFGKDTFLKLLVAQLRYQNPLAPKDGSEFLAQTAQFTIVEKLNEIEKQTKESTRANETLAAASLIGRSVSYALPPGETGTPVPTGRTTLGGSLSGAATEGDVVEQSTSAFTGSGKRVPLRFQMTRLADVDSGPAWELKIFSGSLQLGNASVVTFDANGERTSPDVVVPAAELGSIPGTEGTWPPDGMTIALGAPNDAGRLRVASGAVTFAVREQNGSDGTTFTGIVAGIRFDENDGAQLRVGDREVALSSITEVHVQ